MSKLYRCTLCSKKKQLSEFYLRKATGGVGEYKCKLCIKSKRSKHTSDNYEKVRACNRKAVSKWSKNNRGKCNAMVSKYRATKINALPSWMTQVELSKIRSLYKIARKISKDTKVRHEVDHIIPLRGKTVCGLHTIYNLRVITKVDNLKKGNTLFEDIVCPYGKP